MTPELIMAVSALAVAILTALSKFKHSECCWGLMELDRSVSYNSNETCDTIGSDKSETDKPTTTN